MTMRDAIKIFKILTIGLMSTIFVYPFLHEAGHSLAALAMGAGVNDFNLFPLPNVLCDVSGLKTGEIVFIGLNGILFPLAISVLPSLKNFTLWYVSFLLKGISVFALVTSIVGIVLFLHGSPMEYEDITTVLEFWPDGATSLTFGAIVLIALLIYRMIKEKPIQKIYKYFEIQKGEKTNEKVWKNS